MNYFIEFLEWDSNHFGVKSAKIVLESKILDTEEKRQLRNIFSQFEFLTIVNLQNDIYNNFWLANETNAFLTDINIQFEKKKMTLKQLDPAICLENNYPIDRQIIKIAKKAFEKSRFVNDPNLNKKKSEELYEEWVLNSFNRTDKFFVVSNLNNVVNGFAIFSVKLNTIIIELIAVSENTRGKMIGSELLQKIDNFAITNDIETLRVGTQAQNIKAMNFYNKNNFFQIEISSVYHLWNKNNVQGR